MYNDSDNPFLTVQETTDLLRIKLRARDNFRWTGKGPLWRRHDGRVIYHRDEVLAWSEQRRARTHTANEATPRRPNGRACPADHGQNFGPAYRPRPATTPRPSMERER
jgi:hypothetical protein